MHSKRVRGTEIEEQLDGLLGQDSSTGLSSGDSEKESSSVSPLTSLKSIVLSMDWEINDSILKEFIQELNRLKAVFKQDGIVVKSLQLLEAIGKYILQKKALTHPDSIKLLQSIYRDLEILLLSKGISETVRRNILIDEVAQFMKLKEKLVAPSRPVVGYLSEKSGVGAGSKLAPTPDRHASGSPSSDPALHAKIVPDKEQNPSLEAVLSALEEIKKNIRTEFTALRSELKL